MVLEYCLNEIGCTAPGIHIREEEESPVITPLAMAYAGGELYASAYKEIIGRVEKKLEAADVLFDICRELAEKRGKTLSRADEIQCFSVPRCRGGNAVRLSGNESDALFSDIAYLVTLGPVYGIINDGKVVSLAGAVDRGTVYEAHIETAPSCRKKGFAHECLASLAGTLDKPLMYRCRTENKASLATVRSLKGRLLCRYRVFTARP